MLRCKNCNAKYYEHMMYVYCPYCCGEITPPKTINYGGVSDGQGIYRLTIIYEGEFRNDGHANKCAGKTEIGEEGYRPTKATVVKIKSTCTEQTHPYVCLECAQKDKYYYSHSKDVRCEWCDKDNSWTRR